MSQINNYHAIDYYDNLCVVCHSTTNDSKMASEGNVCAICFEEIMVSGFDYGYFRSWNVNYTGAFHNCINTCNRGGNANQAQCDRCGEYRNVVFVIPICQSHLIMEDSSNDDEDDDDAVAATPQSNSAPTI